MKAVEVVTTSRADFGIYRPVLEALEEADFVDLSLLVSGTHLVSGRGLELAEIRDAYEVRDCIDCMLASDSPGSLSRSAGLARVGFASAFEHVRPDLLFVLGDRYEMHPAACAALPFGIPVAHIHGGEVTAGAIDDALRHSMTKLSHLHFVATHEYGRRVHQLGEERWRIHVTGAPALDRISEVQPLEADEFEREFGFGLPDEFLLATYHPVTLEYESTGRRVQQFREALEGVGVPTLVTMPNADTMESRIVEELRDFEASEEDVHLVGTLGSRGYYTAMSAASAMVGNSSSGLIEAPSFDLPVVNVGRRQDGRVRGANVVDVEPDVDAIEEGLRRALSESMRREARAADNPYGDGSAATRIVEAVREAPEREELVRKTFVDHESIGFE